MWNELFSCYGGSSSSRHFLKISFVIFLKTKKKSKGKSGGYMNSAFIASGVFFVVMSGFLVWNLYFIVHGTNAVECLDRYEPVQGDDNSEVKFLSVSFFFSFFIN